jgi:hypothetical protein
VVSVPDVVVEPHREDAEESAPEIEEKKGVYV